MNYFNSTIYNPNGDAETYDSGDYAGYVTSGHIFESGVCVNTKATKYFCTTSNEEFYSADSVYSNNWAAYQSGASGTFGLGKESPIWTIIGSPATKLFDVYMINMSEWTWAQPSYTPHTTQSIMNLGKFSD